MNTVEKVTELLKELGVPANLKGYSYIRYAILLSLEKPEVLEQLTKVLYVAVAKAFDTTMPRAERAIRNAIEMSMDRGNVDLLNKIFRHSYCKHKGKPTNGEFLATLTDYVRTHSDLGI